MRKLPFLILSFILSTLSSIKIKRNFKKFYKNQNNLFFYGSLSEYKNLNKILENKNSELSYNIKLIDSDSKQKMILMGYYLVKK